MPHVHRRRDATRPSRRVGVGGVNGALGIRVDGKLYVFHIGLSHQYGSVRGLLFKLSYRNRITGSHVLCKSGNISGMVPNVTCLITIQLELRSMKRDFAVTTWKRVTNRSIWPSMLIDSQIKTGLRCCFLKVLLVEFQTPAYATLSTFKKNKNRRQNKNVKHDNKHFHIYVADGRVCA